MCARWRAGRARPGECRGIETVSVRPNFFMIVGAGGNIGVQVGDDGPVIVDSGTERAAEAALAAAVKLSARPIRYIINTSAGANHVGGNVQFARAGRTLAAPGGLGPAIGQTGARRSSPPRTPCCG